MSVNRYVLICNAFILFALLIGPNLYADEWGKISELEKTLGPPENYPEANAIVIFDKGKTEIYVDYIVYSRHVRYKVLNKAGIEEVADIGISYHKDDKIKSLNAHTITPDGKKHKVEKKNFFQKTAGDYREETFAFPAVDSGCIIEYKYKKISEDYGSLDPWYFQDKHYTLYSEICLVLDPGFTYSTAELNVPYPYNNPKEEKIVDLANNAEFKSFTWTMKNIMPVKDEPYMGFRKNYLATLHGQLVSYNNEYFNKTYIKNWTDLGEQFQQFIDDYVNEKKLIKKIADSLIAGLSNKREMAEKLYDYVKLEYKSKADEMGHYFANEKLGELINLKFGTREEKNILLTELLKAADIAAWPVLIGTRNNSVFMPNVYQLHQFNHIITMAEISSSRIFLDTWKNNCPFEILPPDSRASGGLKVDKRQSEIIKIQTVDPPTSRKDYSKIYIGVDNISFCTTLVKYSGYDAIEFGEVLEEKKPADLVNDKFLERLDATHNCDSTEISYLDSGQIELNFFYTLDNYRRNLDTMIAIKPIQFRFTENPFENEKRYFPIDFSYPMEYHSICEMHFDPGILPLSIPKPVTLEIPGIKFTRNCMYDGTKVIINSQLAISRTAYQPGAYSDIRKLFIDMATAATEEVVLTNNSDNTN